MSRRVVRPLLILVLALAPAVAAHASPVDLDASFGNGGIATIPGASFVRDLGLQADGGVLIVDPSSVLRVDTAGVPDPSFTPILPADVNASILSVARLPDGRFHVLHAGGDIICHVYITRHSASGAPDISYGTDGRWEGSGGRCAVTGNIAVTPAGESYFAFASASLPTAFRSIRRVDALGHSLTVIGAVQGSEPPPRTYGRIAMQADGRPVVAIAHDHLSAARLIGASFDSSFGGGIGVATSPTPGSVTYDVALLPSGRVVAAGAAQVESPRSIALTRFTSSGIVDETFGTAGVTVVEVANAGEYVPVVLLAAQPDGKIVYAAQVDKVWPAPSFPRIVIGRLDIDGHPDLTFAPGGMTDLLLARGTNLGAIRVRPDGRILVAGALRLSAPNEPYVPAGVVVQLRGGDDPPAGAVQQRSAVEFFHGGYGHYFVTADLEEIAMLDATPASGWSRTGLAFDVWQGVDATLARVCRFWSDQSFAPRSSHFYTPYPTECETVKHNPAWKFERDVFSVKLPEGAAGAGICANGSRPLYRAYNNGLTGAPNHRYTVDASVLDTLIAQGWTMEGEAATRVFACVPA